VAKLKNLPPEAEKEYEAGFAAGYEHFRAGVASQYWLDAGGCKYRNSLGAILAITGTQRAFGYIDGYRKAESDSHD
jgi:hypothetical protein